MAVILFIEKDTALPLSFNAKNKKPNHNGINEEMERNQPLIREMNDIIYYHSSLLSSSTSPSSLNLFSRAEAKCNSNEVLRLRCVVIFSGNTCLSLTDFISVKILAIEFAETFSN